MKRLSSLFLLFLTTALFTAQAQTTPDGESEPMFGFAQAVSISNGFVFIGEPSNNHQPGAVYIFSKSSEEWTQETMLTADNGMIGDRFGSSVSANGKYVLIGAPNMNDGHGAAFVFEQSNSGSWSQASQFTLPEDTLESSLGSSVILKGDHAFVGAPDHGNGAVFVYRRANNGQWMEVASVMNPDTAGSNFGSSLD